MKAIKHLLLIMFFLQGSITFTQAQIVNIPNANFKAALVANAAVNTNGDTEIQVSEAQAFTGTLFLNNKNINNLTGIEAFTALTDLRCFSNQLTSLDLSANTALSILICSTNQLTSLDLSANTALTVLNCGLNQLTALNLNSNINLTDFSCYNNSLTSLDLSTNTAITNLRCNNNLLTSITLSPNAALETIYCHDNQLSTLDVSNNSVLSSLLCNNNLLTNIILPPSINYLNCNVNQLASLDLSNTTGLTTLFCSNNQLSNLDLSDCLYLYELWCSENLLTNLDVSIHPGLQMLFCDHNQLTTLNVKNGNNINFTNFNAEFNPNLPCIEVDNVAYSNLYWGTEIDQTTSFSTNCFTNTTSISDKIENVNIFPNPTPGLFNVDLGNQYVKVQVEIKNSIGQIIYTNKYYYIQQFNLNLEKMAGGLYFVSIQTEDGNTTMKVIKE